jgi:hypothetical protein
MQQERHALLRNTRPVPDFALLHPGYFRAAFACSARKRRNRSRTASADSFVQRRNPSPVFIPSLPALTFSRRNGLGATLSCLGEHVADSRFGEDCALMRMLGAGKKTRAVQHGLVQHVLALRNRGDLEAVRRDAIAGLG